MPFKDNLEIAVKVLKQIKDEVTSSDDIIPRTEFPILSLATLRSGIVQFGEKMHELWAFEQFSKQIRESSLFGIALERLKREKKPSPATTTYIAVTMMGVGECADTSSLAMALLCKYGCQSPVNAIYLAGLKPNGERFDHVLIIIGDCANLAIRALPSLTADDSPFKQLDDDCVFIDPLIGVVGKAQDIQQFEKEKKYLTTFNVNRITDVVTLDPTKNRDLVELIFANAKQISDEWRQTFGTYKRGAKKIQKDTTQEGSIALPHRQFGKSLGIAIREQLKRITGADKNWSYFAKENYAYLVMGQEALTVIADYLQSKEITTRSPAKVKDSENYLIMVTDCDLEKLKRVETMLAPAALGILEPH